MQEYDALLKVSQQKQLLFLLEVFFTSLCLFPITIFITTCQTTCLKHIMRLNFFKEYTACWESVIEDTLHRPTIIIML